MQIMKVLPSLTCGFNIQPNYKSDTSNMFVRVPVWHFGQQLTILIGYLLVSMMSLFQIIFVLSKYQIDDYQLINKGDPLLEI